ncbi:DUF2752 domain-containing protein [Actinoplanes siamensis]|uniref:DUF2752 domain-containing protein n=1 Tax=Actinoplanes siamensis TaxID=1223317 RepID=A0A919KC09_9ACTN|nr:DUF2752 domain-containing protein [Actinoplanes siamensis]GIF02851.1 hypothetical protein Asi03nite_03890 [Actinoplanes siamensis]
MSTTLPPWLATQPLQGPQVPPDWPAYRHHTAAETDRITRFFDSVATRSPVWLAPLAVLACMGGAVGYTLVTDPTHAEAGAAPTCLLKYTTGFVCPGCGGTRAAWYLLHGNLPAAARHHAIFVFAVPFLLYLYVAWAGRRLFRRRIPQLTISPRAMIVFMVVWAVWSVLRNLPWAPFTAFYV